MEQTSTKATRASQCRRFLIVSLCATIPLGAQEPPGTASAHTPNCGENVIGPVGPDGTTDWSSLAPAEAKAEFKKWRAQRRAQSDWISLIGPFYSIAEGHQASVYLTNGFAEPLTFDVVAADREGKEYPLGAFRLAPRSHIELDLREALAGAAPSFHSGSLRATFFGDPTMAGGWIIQRRGKAIVEIPFELAPIRPAGENAAIQSYWDLGSLPADVTPRFYVVNPGTVPTFFTAVVTADGQLLATTAQEIAPLSRQSLDIFQGEPPVRGSVAVRAEPGAPLPILSGMLEGPDTLLQLPTFLTGEGRAEQAYASMEARLLQDEAGGTQPVSPTRLHLVLFNPLAEAQQVTVEVVEHMLGTPLVKIAVRVAALQGRSINLTEELLARFVGEGSLPQAVRLKVSSSTSLAPPLATVTSGEAAVRSLEFYSMATLHPGGRYLIPDLDEHDAWTTILNLGDETAEIYGQLFWEGGTYAIPDPLVIPSGGAGTFDFDDIVNAAVPDLLGRLPTRTMRSGYFHWTVRRGGGEVVGRTHIRGFGWPGDIGTNCKGCCMDLPVGVIIPEGLINFPVGGSHTAKPSLIRQTCDGVLGPWPVSPNTRNVPTPFNWPANAVSASSDGSDTLSFEGPVVQALSLTCNIYYRDITDTTPVITGCWDCAKDVPCMFCPIIAGCCKPGSTDPDVADCDWLAGNGWQIYDTNLRQCFIATPNGENETCVGPPCV